MTPQILALDVAGAPHRWLNVCQAAHYYATGAVAWTAGTNEFVLRDGIQRATGAQSKICTNSIIAIRGRDLMVRNFDHTPSLTKEMLLARDRYVCAYCAQRFRYDQFDLEHIIPKSKGGADSWTNLVAACKACNNRKADRTPEAAGMKLHYVPYAPNLRGVHPQQSQDPGRPDGVPDGWRAEELAHARGAVKDRAERSCSARPIICYPVSRKHDSIRLIPCSWGIQEARQSPRICWAGCLPVPATHVAVLVGAENDVALPSMSSTYAETLKPHVSHVTLTIALGLGDDILLEPFTYGALKRLVQGLRAPRPPAA